MKHTRGKSKNKVVKALARKGLTVERITNSNRQRVWRVSDGKEFQTFNEMRIAYQL